MRACARSRRKPEPSFPRRVSISPWQRRVSTANAASAEFSSSRSGRSSSMASCRWAPSKSNCQILTRRNIDRIAVASGGVPTSACHASPSLAINVSSAIRWRIGSGAVELACIAVSADARCSETVAGEFRPTAIKMRSRVRSSGRSQPRWPVPWAQACHCRTIWSATLPSSLSEVEESVSDDLTWANIQPAASVSIKMSSTGASVSKRRDRMLASPKPNRSGNRRSTKGGPQTLPLPPPGKSLRQPWRFRPPLQADRSGLYRKLRS
jgi:hypothetical protein